MNQDRNRDQDMPNRQPNMDHNDGSRDSRERGRGNDGERNRTAGESSRSRNSGGINSGGITNRSLDRERSEQDLVPERGQGQSER